MWDFLRLNRAHTQLGFQPYRIDASHPGWYELQANSRNGRSVALLDNTTLRNALTIMDAGLSSDRSNNALLLPDLCTLFFAYAYFDTLVVLDQGLLESERSAVQRIFQEINVIAWKDISSKKDKHNRTLAEAHHLQLTGIMEEFFRWKSLHKRWSESWSKIYSAKIEPMHFRRESDIDALLESPAGKLAEAWSQESDPPSLAITRPDRYRWPRWADRLKSPERKLSALASYHTYRSIFYFCLADAFGIAYIPCGARGISTDVLPLNVLQRERANHLLNRSFKNITLEYARKAFDRDPTSKRQAEEFRLQIPIVRLNPTLAALLNRLLQFETRVRAGLEHPTWQTIAYEWREEAAGARAQFDRWIGSQEQNQIGPAVKEEIQSLLASHGTVADRAVESVVSVVVGGGFMATGFLTSDPHIGELGTTPFVDGLAGLLRRTQDAWEYAARFPSRKRLKFLLRARELARTVLDGEELLFRVWGRQLTPFEREYLDRLTELNPVYGV